MRSLPTLPRCHPLLRSPRRAAGGRAKCGGGCGPATQGPPATGGVAGLGDTRDATVLRVAGSGAPLSPLLHRQGLGWISGEEGSTACTPHPSSDIEGMQIGERGLVCPRSGCPPLNISVMGSQAASEP